MVTAALAKPQASPEASTITVYMPRAEKQALRVYCVTEQITISEYVLGLIRKDQAR